MTQRNPNIPIGCFLTMWLFNVAAIVVFWIMVGYVAWHFLSRYW
jgi:hypothetical protein